MVAATALYAFYTPVTAVDRHEVYLRRYESPAATITITTAKYIHTTAWFSTLLLVLPVQAHIQARVSLQTFISLQLFICCRSTSAFTLSTLS